MSLSLAKADARSSFTNLEHLKDALPDYAKDIRINLGSVLTPEGAPDLSPEQIAGIALASAYATRNEHVIAAFEGEFAASAGSAVVQAAKAAATVMAMNNVYYRFVHLSNDAEFKAMPAKLRMSVIGSPGISKVDFELMSLAVSAINGCGMCIEAHAHELSKQGMSKTGIQSSVRIAATVNAAHQGVSLS